MKLVKHADDQRPFAFPLVRVPFAWAAYWALTGLDYALKRLHSLIWQARHHLGWVMFDDPCPRCKQSLWRLSDGCNCRVVSGVTFMLTLPPDAEVREEPDRYVVTYKPRLRRELFHWGRGHEFHSGAARDALLRDDELYGQRPPQRTRRIDMGATKEAALEAMDADEKEVVAECDSCGGDVTSERYNEMPFEGGEPVFVLCEDCDG